MSIRHPHGWVKGLNLVVFMTGKGVDIYSEFEVLQMLELERFGEVAKLSLYFCWHHNQVLHAPSVVFLHLCGGVFVLRDSFPFFFPTFPHSPSLPGLRGHAYINTWDHSWKSTLKSVCPTSFTEFLNYFNIPLMFLTLDLQMSLKCRCHQINLSSLLTKRSLESM